MLLLRWIQQFRWPIFNTFIAVVVGGVCMMRKEESDGLQCGVYGISFITNRRHTWPLPLLLLQDSRQPYQSVRQWSSVTDSCQTFGWGLVLNCMMRSTIFLLVVFSALVDDITTAETQPVVSKGRLIYLFNLKIQIFNFNQSIHKFQVRLASCD